MKILFIAKKKKKKKKNWGRDGEDMKFLWY